MNAMVPPETPGTTSAQPMRKPINAMRRWCNKDIRRSVLETLAGETGHKKRQADCIGPAFKVIWVSDLDVREGLAQTNYAVACFPGAALFQQFNALEALEDVTFDDEAARTLEAFVLGHGVIGESVASDALKGK